MAYFKSYLAFCVFGVNYKLVSWYCAMFVAFYCDKITSYILSYIWL